MNNPGWLSRHLCVSREVYDVCRHGSHSRIFGRAVQPCKSAGNLYNIGASHVDSSHTPVFVAELARSRIDWSQSGDCSRWCFFGISLEGRRRKAKGVSLGIAEIRETRPEGRCSRAAPSRLIFRFTPIPRACTPGFAAEPSGALIEIFI